MKDIEMLDEDMKIWRETRTWEKVKENKNMSEKKIYAVGRIGKKETQTSFYKFFEHKEDAEKELKEMEIYLIMLNGLVIMKIIIHGNYIKIYHQ